MSCQRSARSLGLLLTLSLLPACTPPVYSPQQLTQLGVKETTGIVSKQSRGSFVLRGDDGVERIYRTGEMTQYLPANYRSQEADQVRVVYREVLERSGRTKYEVRQLESLAVAEQNQPLSSPVVGRIIAVAPGTFHYPRRLSVRYSDRAAPATIYLPRHGLAVTRNQQPVTIMNWYPLVDSEISVSIERLPIRRGNATIYVARRIELATAKP